jgi:hypothetical protein
LVDTYTGCPRRNEPDFGRVFLYKHYSFGFVIFNIDVLKCRVTDLKKIFVMLAKYYICEKCVECDKNMGIFVPVCSTDPVASLINQR